MRFKETNKRDGNGFPLLNFLMISHQGLSKFYKYDSALAASVRVLLNQTKVYYTMLHAEDLPALKAGHGSKIMS